MVTKTLIGVGLLKIIMLHLFQSIPRQTYGNDCGVFAIMVDLHLLYIISDPLVPKSG